MSTLPYISDDALLLIAQECRRAVLTAPLDTAAITGEHGLRIARRIHPKHADHWVRLLREFVRLSDEIERRGLKLRRPRVEQLVGSGGKDGQA